MLITIEGPSCSGKSTLCRALQSRLDDCRIIGRPNDRSSLSSSVVYHPEISFNRLREMRPKSGLDEMMLQVNFAHLVTHRLRVIQDQQSDRSVNIADRDITSFYAHARARLIAHGPEYLQLFRELFKYVWSQTPVVPLLFIYVKTPREVCMKRATLRDEKPMQYIFEPSYFERISEGYQHMLMARGDHVSMQLDGELATEDLVEQVITKTHEIKSHQPLDPRHLMNRLIECLG